MVDSVISSTMVAKIKETIHEDHHYKFKPWEKEGAVLKEIKDSNNWTLLMHYLNLSSKVEKSLINELTKDHGIDVNQEGNQKHNAIICAAKNEVCRLEILQHLVELGCNVKSVCETGANIMMYYFRYNQDGQKAALDWFLSQGIDPKHADNNKMTLLHYTMINFNAYKDHIVMIVTGGADVNAQMVQDIDALDLIIYTQNMKNADFRRILGIVRFLVEAMDCEKFDLRKLKVIEALLCWDRLLMCKLQQNSEKMTGKKEFFQIPPGVFSDVANYV